jgi:hypothetical protein
VRRARKQIPSSNQAFKDDAGFLRDTQSREALLAVSLLVSAEAHRGKTPLSPGEWGRFLEHIAADSPRP